MDFLLTMIVYFNEPQSNVIEDVEPVDMDHAAGNGGNNGCVIA